MQQVVRTSARQSHAKHSEYKACGDPPFPQPHEEAYSKNWGAWKWATEAAYNDVQADELVELVRFRRAIVGRALSLSAPRCTWADLATVDGPTLVEKAGSTTPEPVPMPAVGLAATESPPHSEFPEHSIPLPVAPTPPTIVAYQPVSNEIQAHPSIQASGKLPGALLPSLVAGNLDSVRKLVLACRMLAGFAGDIQVICQHWTFSGVTKKAIAKCVLSGPSHQQSVADSLVVHLLELEQQSAPAGKGQLASCRLVQSGKVPSVERPKISVESGQGGAEKASPAAMDRKRPLLQDYIANQLSDVPAPKGRMPPKKRAKGHVAVRSDSGAMVAADLVLGDARATGWDGKGKGKAK